MARKRVSSGVDWFPKIPAEWKVKRIKDFYRIVGGGTPSAAEIGVGRAVPWATPTDFSDAQRKLSRTARSVTEEGHKEIGRPIVGQDGLLVSCRAPAGKVALPALPISFNQGCKGLSPRGKSIHREWFFYALVAQREQIEDAAKGATFTEISGDALKRISFPIPSYDEQARIASWLNHRVASLDKRLELNSKKRDLLIELKKAIIQKSTLHGIVANAKLRDSGIPWVGRAPEHWQVFRLGALFFEAADSGIEGLPMLSVSIHSGISDKELNDEEMDRKVNRSADKSLYKRVRKDDLVYNQMRAWQGAFGTAKLEGLVSPAYVVARPRAMVHSRYIESLLRSPAGIEEMRRRSRGITDFRLRLYWDEFKNIHVALPPRAEQEAIARYVDRKVKEINRQVELIHDMEKLLYEQRGAVIHAAVTGALNLSSYVAASSA